jgi:hypothetical protein
MRYFRHYIDYRNASCPQARIELIVINIDYSGLKYFHMGCAALCAYGDGGIVQVIKLPENTKQCDVIYRRKQDPLEPRRKLVDVLADIVCK